MFVFICSPYRGDTALNTAKARTYCRMAALQGYVPIAPHIFFTQFLDDDCETERKISIDCGIRLMAVCQEMWIFGEPSGGMKFEMDWWLINKPHPPKRFDL